MARNIFNMPRYQTPMNTSGEFNFGSLIAGRQKLVIQAAVRRQNGSCGPFGIVATKERHQRRDVVHLSNPGCCGSRVNQRLHVFEELLIALEPLICPILLAEPISQHNPKDDMCCLHLPVAIGPGFTLLTVIP